MLQILLFLTHRLDDHILDRFDNIAIPSGFDRRLLVDAAAAGSCGQRNTFPFQFSELIKTGYRPIAAGVIPGSNHFPVLEFCHAFPRYDYIWVMEYDVAFTGDWRTFFSAIQSRADLLSAFPRTFADEPDWYWWSTLHIPGRNRSRPAKRYRASSRPVAPMATFNPIYRVSRRAAAYLRGRFLEGCIGHHEVAMPTLLNLAGMSVEDLGTAPAGCGVAGRWYTRETFRYVAPGHPLPVPRLHNMLYHPVKDFFPILIP